MSNLLKLSIFAAFESGTVNGEDDITWEEQEKGVMPKVPCCEIRTVKKYNIWIGKYEDKEELRWCPIIDVDSGVVINWKKGTTLDCYYKTSDECAFDYEQDGVTVLSYDDYVPDFLSIEDEGYGDYIIIKIDEEGRIHNWDRDEFYKWVKKKIKETKNEDEDD